MTYQEVIKNNLERQQNIMNALCEARDSFDVKKQVVEVNYFQGLIDTFQL